MSLTNDGRVGHLLNGRIDGAPEVSQHHGGTLCNKLIAKLQLTVYLDFNLVHSFVIELLSLTLRYPAPWKVFCKEPGTQY